jgi:hypothetical protein
MNGENYIIRSFTLCNISLYCYGDETKDEADRRCSMRKTGNFGNPKSTVTSDTYGYV